MVRRVTEAVWHDEGDGNLRFEIEAGSFCHQMVRSIVGTLVEVGTGRILTMAQNRPFDDSLAAASNPAVTAVNKALSTWKDLVAPRKVERTGIPATGV